MIKRLLIAVVISLFCFTACTSKEQREYEKAKAQAAQAEKELEKVNMEIEQFQSDYNNWKNLYDKANNAK